MGKIFNLLAICVGSVVLVGCGGGGGGTSATLASFSSWSAVQRSSAITVDGISQSGTYTWNSGTDRITGRTDGASSTGASYTATYDSNGQATNVTLSPAGGSPVSWSRTSGDTFGSLIINSNIDAVVSADGSKIALAANPYDYNWDYQSFGVWTTGAGTGSGTFGAMSIGSTTPGSAIPTSGTATYSGYTGGRYVNSSGQYWFTSSSMTAAANFGTRSVTFNTTGTQVTPDLINVSNNTSLNMSGSLSYAAGTNQITGSVTTTGGLTGSVNGRFYGPAAQEIGGTFSVTGSGLTGYAGAFGGKR
jgi:hypothetical protein